VTVEPRGMAAKALCLRLFLGLVLAALSVVLTVLVADPVAAASGRVLGCSTYDGGAPVYDASVLCVEVRTVALVEAVGSDATAVRHRRQVDATSEGSVAVSGSATAAKTGGTVSVCLGETGEAVRGNFKVGDKAGEPGTKEVFGVGAAGMVSPSPCLEVPTMGHRHRTGSVRLAPADIGCLWGIRTEVVADRAFPLVTGLPPWDCRSIAKASKVRILHLPPRAERPLTCGDAGRGPFPCTRPVCSPCSLTPPGTSTNV
jgi:hypothetical protein